MINKLRNGNILEYANATTHDIAAGDVVPMNDMVGVAVADIPADESGAVDIDGVFSLPAGTGAWSQGEALYLRTDGKFYTATATGAIPAGVAAADKTTAATTGYVLLSKGR